MKLATLVVIAISALPASAQSLAERITTVTDRPEYKHARWGILVVDAASGSAVFERNPEQLCIPASTTKLFTCCAALANLGPNYQFHTRVVTDGLTVDGTLFGNVVLIASGDPTMGGRNQPDGTMAFCNGDHTYADATSTSAGVTSTDPLAGLKDLARQIKSSGVRVVRGDVLIDDRLFDHIRATGSGPDRVTPITINDNVIDFIIKEGPNGAEVKFRPETAMVQLDNQVKIGGKTPNVEVVPEGPWRVSVRGSIPKGGKTYVRITPIDDPAAFARGLFIECLRREGIEVAASPLGSPQTPLPTGANRQIAEHVSLPFREVTKVTLKVSHNLYASMMPLLVAAHHKERSLTAGLRLEGAFLRRLGLDMGGVAFAGGAGGARADSASPRAAVSLLLKMREKPEEYAALKYGLPILGVDGTLADVVPADSPAKGHVHAKTGTLNWADLANRRTLLRSKALAGTIETKSGKELVFAIFLNDKALNPGETAGREGKTLGKLCEILYEYGP